MMTSSISVSGLGVRLGGLPVLRGIDLEIAAGEVTGLLGPSGSGKTTLLRTIVGLQRQGDGRVSVLGRPAGHPRLRAEIGYMTQSPSVYGDLTAAGNLRYHAALHGRGRRAVADVLDAVGLAELAQRPVATLSGGERSRVSLGCALVARPRLLVLDEPTVGLDPVLRRDLWQLSPGAFQRVAPVMLGVFPFITMFLVTSVAMVRERTSGTLERLLTTPIGKADLVLGYGLAFGLLALVQAVVVAAVALGLLGLREPASVSVLVLLAVATAVLGSALGLGVSALATTEFQAVQFMPAVVAPQILLCGLFTPTEQMAGWLDAVSRAMPLRYAAPGMSELTGAATVPAAVWTNLAVVAAIAVAALALGAATLRRRST